MCFKILLKISKNFNSNYPYHVARWCFVNYFIIFTLMKSTSKIFLFAILFAIMLLNTTCDKKLLTKVTFDGYVYDSLGGKPVKGIWVTLYACKAGYQGSQCTSYQVGQAQTDASGHFHIHNDAASSNNYGVQVNGFGPFGLQNSDDEYWLQHNFSTIYLNEL